MLLIKKTAKILGYLTAGTLVVTKYFKLDFEQFPLKQFYPWILKTNPNIAKRLLKSLLYWEYLKPVHKGDKELILDEGWDTNGDYINQLQNFGFDQIITGPLSFDPYHDVGGMGTRFAYVKFVIAKQQNPKYKANISIIPASDVCIYTPYLISIDMCRAIGQMAKIVDNIYINLDNPCFPKQYITLENIKQLFIKAQQKMQTLPKKPNIFFRYHNMIFTHQALTTPLVQNQINNPQSQLKSSRNTLIIIGNGQMKNVRMVSANQLYTNPSLSITK